MKVDVKLRNGESVQFLVEINSDPFAPITAVMYINGGYYQEFTYSPSNRDIELDILCKIRRLYRNNMTEMEVRF